MQNAFKFVIGEEIGVQTVGGYKRFGEVVTLTSGFVELREDNIIHRLMYDSIIQVSRLKISENDQIQMLKTKIEYLEEKNKAQFQVIANADVREYELNKKINDLRVVNNRLLTDCGRLSADRELLERENARLKREVHATEVAYCNYRDKYQEQLDLNAAYQAIPKFIVNHYKNKLARRSY
jgi:FtsZ-binding cell division protein ZapB